MTGCARAGLSGRTWASDEQLAAATDLWAERFRVFDAAVDQIR
jgi:hypothetical protein